ncbi:Ppx/GppA family phosphatase [Nitrospirales bacterium NOB]|nr:MAG: putative exopolyphosphatase [Nitrospira sp. OLB3]MBV6469379.1 Exopolyphosphatase [Nitrospirota bacterium]MCE7967010.1 Ppx/GppA family phosphatase [Nitrospira sp. NTP2]MCK6494529.1 Ppx/GppA family phosphatase [Nitrospira sp.]MDL1890393.1 Ppx/GppA family phosphatase [Nitrospirales bacterium NOB]MEB2337723.1 Ppx/GppA phosphatase family protein [Nitrospirales bacterium]
MPKLAVLDIGTNSIHMVLAEVQPDYSYKILDRFKDMTRLGDGVFTSRRLSDQAMTRGLDVIRNLVTLARNKGYERIEGVATSAVREARNGGEFLDHVAQQTGLVVRVITGTEEARLIFLGVQNSVALPEQPSLVIDIGGGSVELIVGNRDSILHARSLKLGAIRLKDLYLTKTPPSKSMLEALDEAVTAQLKSALGPYKTKRVQQVIATSGMAANLAEVIHLQRTGRPLPQLNLAKVSAKEIGGMEKRLAESSLKARLEIPGLDPKRVDTLLPAATVFRVLLDLLDKKELTLCDKAIREGIIYDFVQRHREGIQAERDIPDVRRRNILSLARRCHVPEAHALHVAALALQLFDQTTSLHGYGAREREWLEFAAVLHDIGYMINSRQHHKHAYYLIKHSDLSGFTADEIDLIANIARYHRRSVPGRKHEEYTALPNAMQRIVTRLSAFLRIADGLDRSQFGVVQQLSVALDKTVLISVRVSGDAELELWAARSRSDLFEKVFKRPVEFVVAPQTEEAS